jgi:hypothetical protein
MLPPLPDQPVAAEADPTQPSVDHLVPPSALGRLTASSSTITALNSDAILPSPGYQYGSRDSVVSGTSQQDEASGSEDNSKKKSASVSPCPGRNHRLTLEDPNHSRAGVPATRPLVVCLFGEAAPGGGGIGQ